DVLGILARVQSAVRGYAEAARARGLDRGDCPVERPLPVHGFVVPLAVAVQMYREREIRRRRVLIELLLEQERVRAEIDELLARDDALDYLRHILVDQRLAARYRHDGRAALVDGLERVLDRHALAQDLVRIVDLAAPRAREVALEQRLEHQHERIALVALELLLEDVARDAVSLNQRDSHRLSRLLSYRISRPCPCWPAYHRGSGS